MKPRFYFKLNKSVELRKQRAKHINHGFGNPNISKKFCIFCKEEGRYG